MQTPLKAAVIGLGVGEQLALGFSRVPGVEIAALVDFDAAKLAEVGERFPGVARYSDASEVLGNPEIGLVAVASYDDAHRDQVVRALEHGKHVFVEKPVCLYESEAREIRAALRANPELSFSSNLILRTSPRFTRVREMIATGEFGELFYAEADYDYGRLHKITEGWRGKLPFYSAVLGGSVHMVDLLLWLTGDRVVEVQAFGNDIASAGSGFSNFDLVAALLRFESGLVAKVTANFGCVRPHFHGLGVFGTKATFENALPDGRLYLSRDRDSEPVSVTEEYPGLDKGDLAEDFARAIVSGGTPRISADEVFDCMSVCFAIERAVHSGEPVRVEYL